MIINRKNIIVYPRKYFVEDIVTLRRSGEILNNLVLHQTSETNFWLVNRRSEKLQPDYSKMSKAASELTLNTVLLKNGVHPGAEIPETNFFNDAHLYVEAEVESGINPNRISGYLKYKDSCFVIDELYLVGAEMLKIPTVNSTIRFSAPNAYEMFLTSEYARERWETSIAALNREIWERLNMLNYLIVGAGKSGELALMELARLGVGNITVCDGCVLERRHIGEMKLVTDRDVGRNKAETVVEKVSGLRRSSEKTDCFNFRAVESFNFDSYEARKAAEESDVIICCADSDGGRGYASYVAARFHKVLLDIGTGVLPSGENIKNDYHVKLILPGDGCLRCFGGIDEEQCDIEIFNRNEQLRQRRKDHPDRVGSLSSLNALAVNEAILMLQDLCKGEIESSTWVQFERKTGRTLVNPAGGTKEKCDCKK